MVHTLYGHGTVSLLQNIALGLMPLLLLKLCLIAQRRRKVGWLLIWGILLFLFMPNSAYMIAEVRHLLFLDGIADNAGMAATSIFLGIGILGTIVTVKVIRESAQLITVPGWFTVIYLSFASAFGVALGLTGLNSWDILDIPKVTNSVKIVITEPILLVSIALLGTALTLTTLTVDVANSTIRTRFST